MEGFERSDIPAEIENAERCWIHAVLNEVEAETVNTNCRPTRPREPMTSRGFAWHRICGNKGLR
jgi:hypothetical protein